MAPEIIAALIVLAVVVIGVITAGARYIKTLVEERTEDMKAEAKRERDEEESRRKMREARREFEMERLRQDAIDQRALMENLTNLTTALLDMNKGRLEDRQFIGDQFHETRIALTNNSESVGELATSVDRVADAVHEHTGLSNAILKAVQELKDKADIILNLLRGTPPTPAE